MLNTRKHRAANIFIYLLGFFLLAAALWTRKFFGAVNLDQVISTISFGTEGVLSADSLFLKRFIIWCVAFPIIATFCVRKLKIHWLVLFVGTAACFYQFSLINYILQLRTPHQDYFNAQYADVNTITFTKHHPKSLVLIYVESLENTYTDKHIFGHDLLKSLDQPNSQTISFAKFEQKPGTGWTMAGIIASQCGIPFKPLTIFNENRTGEFANYFLPGAKCLSDVLAENGYHNIFLSGASLNFSGKGTFLKNHHYDTIYGREEWLQHGYQESDMQAWGLADDDLLNEAKLVLAKEIQKNNLFNLTILTVNTHGYEGQLNKSCQKQGYRDFPGIVECTAVHIADFIQYAKQQGWLNKINIVVIGDHLAMQNIVSDKLDPVSHRTIFNIIVSQNALIKNTDEINHFDLLPTLLRSMGFQFQGNKLGLGYAAINQSEKDAPFERIQLTEDQLQQRSQRYNQLWLK